MKKLFVVLIVVAAAAAPEAQSQTADVQGPTFRTGVDVISVDVGVVDSKGKPVDDLRAPDFAVKIDGEVRKVVSAELVRIDVEAAKKQVADKSETFFTTNLTPPNGRQIVLAVDQVNIKPGTVRTLMTTAARFVDRLSPLDQVAFVAYPEPGPRVNFTSDRLRVKLAMERLIGHEPNTAQTRLNIGVSEAVAIYEKRDQITMAEVERRECQNLRNAQAFEQCQRDIVQDSSVIAQRVRESGEQSMNGLRQLLRELALVEGNKALILISEGVVDQSSNDLDGLARLAAAARVSLNILVVDQSRGDAAVGERPPSEFDDRRMEVQGLQSIAFASRGAVFHVAGTGEGIFDRLLSEISAYYLLGVEQRPSDAQGDRHRVDVEVRRRGVTIRSRQAFVLSAAARPKLSAEDNLRAALTSPFPVAELPVRATTFVQQEAAGGKIRLLIAADIGQPGAQPAPMNVAYVVINDENRVAASFSAKPTLTRAGNLETEPLQFLGSALVDPGIYSLRFAAVDGEGRRGSVIRDVNAWKMDGEELALGDLVIGNAPSPGQGLAAAVEPHVTTETLAAYFELYSTSAATFDSATVAFEVADDPDGPALTTLDARVLPGRQPTWRVAQGLLGARALPPGRYVARAKISRDGKAVGVLTRPFVLDRSAAPGAIVASVVSPAAFMGSLPRFDRDAIVGREFVGTMLDAVAQRSPALKDALVEARAGRYGAAALDALTAGDQPAAAFLRGIDLFIKGQLNEAATQLQLAAGPRREFFPAAFYLGACFAAAGRDRDAAGVWQMAMGSEPRPTQVYTMAADARLRDGQPASAVDILRPAYERTPADDEIARRLAMAYVMTGRYAEAIPVLDAYLVRHGSDQDLLLTTIAAYYEVARAGQTLSNVDNARLRKYSSAYKGPQAALVEKYLAVMNGR
jgi:VWFA-related protein